MYIIMAYRFGDKEKHSYVVGLEEDLEDAKKLAQKEEYHRGGKYSCVVDEMEPGQIKNNRVYETEGFVLDTKRDRTIRSNMIDERAYYADEEDYIRLLEASIRHVPFITDPKNEEKAQEKRKELQDVIKPILIQFKKAAKINKHLIKYHLERN